MIESQPFVLLYIYTLIINAPNFNNLISFPSFLFLCQIAALKPPSMSPLKTQPNLTFDLPFAQESWALKDQNLRAHYQTSKTAVVQSFPNPFTQDGLLSHKRFSSSDMTKILLNFLDLLHQSLLRSYHPHLIIYLGWGDLILSFQYVRRNEQKRLACNFDYDLNGMNSKNHPSPFLQPSIYILCFSFPTTTINFSGSSVYNQGSCGKRGN